MRITVTSIDLSSERPMGNIRAPGYNVGFTASLVAGTAIFVPAYVASLDLIGHSFEVEPNQETVENLVVLPAGSERRPQLSATPRKGDFEVQGVITSVDPFVIVSVDDASFMVSAGELGGSSPRPGDWVTFVARGLSLWDEAI